MLKGTGRKREAEEELAGSKKKNSFTGIKKALKKHKDSHGEVHKAMDKAAKDWDADSEPEGAEGDDSGPRRKFRKDKGEERGLILLLL